MNGYCHRWQGSTDPADETGTAHYRIEGQDFVVQLPRFADAQRLDALLWLAFQQGKDFAYKAVRQHVGDALTLADHRHSLTLDPRRATVPTIDGDAS